MDDYSGISNTFKDCLNRSRNLVGINGYLSQNYTSVLDSSDLLRAAVVLSVSAFDYLMHELFRITIQVRLRENKAVDRFDIPFALSVAKADARADLIDQFVREKNSYKSFVDPAKFAEAMKCFVDDPWDKTAGIVGQPQDTLKRRLKIIYGWRNRIAHEADINPVLAGAERWPIVESDVLAAITDLEMIGLSAIQVVRQ